MPSAPKFQFLSREHVFISFHDVVMFQIRLHDKIDCLLRESVSLRLLLFLWPKPAFCLKINVFLIKVHLLFISGFEA